MPVITGIITIPVITDITITADPAPIVLAAAHRAICNGSTFKRRSTRTHGRLFAVVHAMQIVGDIATDADRHCFRASASQRVKPH
jgi:hypothetical protein